MSELAHKFPTDDDPIMMQRLVMRVMRYWLNLCGERAFPKVSDIVPGDMGDDWESCFVLDAHSDHPFPMFGHLGSELGKYSGVFLSGRKDWTLTLLDKVTLDVSKAVESCAPVLLEDEFKRFDGKIIKFRCVLLPMSEDGHTVTQVMGAANGKVA